MDDYRDKYVLELARAETLDAELRALRYELDRLREAIRISGGLCAQCGGTYNDHCASDGGGCAGDFGQCHEQGCQRQSGHSGLHFASRYTDGFTATDEWG